MNVNKTESCPFCDGVNLNFNADDKRLMCDTVECNGCGALVPSAEWNTRADGWISASINPQFSGRFTVDSSYGVRDAFFTEGFVSGDFRWQDCQTGNDEGMENYDGVEFKVYNWMPLPKAASCGE